MTLEESILFYEEQAKKCNNKVNQIILGAERCEQDKQEYTQLAEWLKELQERRERSEIAKPTGESEQFVPNEDLISRKSAIDAIEQLVIPEDMCVFEILSHIELAIGTLPSAQPEQRWVPCSETVDIPDHEVMACDRYGEFIIGYLDCKDEQWLCESDGSLMYNPVAWCELPKPYKEGGVDG